MGVPNAPPGPTSRRVLPPGEYDRRRREDFFLHTTLAYQTSDVVFFVKLRWPLLSVVTVEYALENTTLEVIVYQGQLDIICDVVGGSDSHCIHWLMLEEYRHKVFTARCTLVQSAVLRSHVVCLSVRLSVCNIGEL